MSLGSACPRRYWNNNPPENGTAAVLRYLDQASSRGVSVVLELPRRWVSATSCRSGSCLKMITTLVSTVCGHRALSGWYMADEPDKPRSWIAPSTLAAVAGAVRAAESGVGCPQLPISSAFATLQEPGNASAASHYNNSVTCTCGTSIHARTAHPAGTQSRVHRSPELSLHLFPGRCAMQATWWPRSSDPSGSSCRDPSLPVQPTMATTATRPSAGVRAGASASELSSATKSMRAC